MSQVNSLKYLLLARPYTNNVCNNCLLLNDNICQAWDYDNLHNTIRACPYNKKIYYSILSMRIK